ncbi:MAG: molybdenum cofactor biosynthesis protein MoaE [Gammaproteobacteria bacterium]|nr:molybdenum cofactor biosynthesis protein MoaE [Gammaproteobacteria bacterium]
MGKSRLHPGPLPAHGPDEPVSPAHGGEVTFCGRVRAHHRGRAVSAIVYHAQRPLAEARLCAIETEAAERFGVVCRVAHAIGRLTVGEISVAVQIRGGHRAECFAACRWAIDTIKSSVPIWKEEHYADGSIEFQDGTPLREVAD